MINYCFIRPRT